MIYLKSLFSFAPGRFILGCFLTCLSTLFTGVGLLMLIPLLHYANWLPNTAASEDVFSKLMVHLPEVKGHLPLLLTLLIFLFLMIAIAGLQYLQARVMAYLRQDYLFHLREQLNRAIAEAKWSFLLERKLKHMEHMLTMGLTQIDGLTYYCIQMIGSSIVIVFYFGFSLVIAWKLTLLTCLVTFILFGFLRKQRAVLLGQNNYLAQRTMQEQLGAFLEGVKLAKSYNQTQSYMQHFGVINKTLATTQKAAALNRSFLQFLFLTATAVIFVVIFLTAVDLFKVTLLSLIALLIVFARLLPRVSDWQQSYLQMMNLLPIFTESQNMLIEFNTQKEILTQHKPIPFNQDIFLDQVSYCYQHTHKKVLENISCHIPANSTTALVGPSGAGKTTLADLLLGLLEPSEGSIFLDQIPLNSDRLEAWRDAISYVPQEAYFFNESLRANLRWAAPTASDEDIWQTLKQTAAYDFVQGLPQQLDTLIGDRGIHLSGGERQRLALARALLRRPKALLLDEATSALDQVNEELIYQTLSALKGQMTLIIIAHRYSTIRAVDQVLVLNQERLVEQGAPAILLSNPESYFSQLFKGQQHAVL